MHDIPAAERLTAPTCVQLLDRQLDNVLGGAAGLAGTLLGRAHSAGRQVAGKVCFRSFNAEKPPTAVSQDFIHMRRACNAYAMSAVHTFTLIQAAGPLMVLLMAVQTLVQEGPQTSTVLRVLVCMYRLKLVLR